MAPLLATKATSRPVATGTSIAMWRRPPRSACHAPRKIGAAENSSTGSVSSQLAHCSRRNWSAGISPAPAT
ncbi:hypothetical protein ABXN37_00725 [Piscinibacter sakaiensis]|uniref:hypothetical protein n=1 Tax=Piscinibacter sakaiensis TaxID=1547922 RepID=UPI00372AB4E0